MRICKPINDLNCIKIIYNAYVRSSIEYASPIWCPQYITYRERLEHVQSKFIKHLNYKFKKYFDTYEDACLYYNVHLLYNRRLISDMLLFYDIITSRIDCPDLVRRVGLNVPLCRTRHTKLFHVPHHRTNFTRNSVLTRLANTYNSRFSHIDPYTMTKLTFGGLVVKTLTHVRE